MTIQQFYLTKQQAGDKIFNSMVQKVKKEKLGTRNKQDFIKI